MQSPYHGRSRELEALSTMCAPGHVVLVHGPPGIGKSRLCREFVKAYKETQRVIHIDCQHLKEFEALDAALASALHIQLSPHHTITQLVTSLRARHVKLLVLDNADHIEPGTWAHTLIEQIPSLCILVNAQAPRADLPHTLQLDALDVATAEAEGLKLWRALISTSRQAQIDDADLMRVASRTAGIPLAIELCAPHLEVMSCDTLLEQLEARLLIRGDTLNPLRTSLELAWSQLDAHTRRVLMVASLCQASFDAKTLAAIMACAITTLTEPLLELRRRGLLSTTEDAHTTPRYRLLESVRDLARHHHETSSRYDTDVRAWYEVLEHLGHDHVYEVFFRRDRERTARLLHHHQDFVRALDVRTQPSPGILCALLCVLHIEGGSVRVEAWREPLERVLADPAHAMSCCMSAFFYMSSRWRYVDMATALTELDDALHRLQHALGESHPWVLFLETELRYRQHIIDEQDAFVTRLARIEELLAGADPGLCLWASFHLTMSRIPTHGHTIIAELAALSGRFEQLDMMELSARAIAQCAIASLRSNRFRQGVGYLDQVIDVASRHDLDELHARALSLRAMVSEGTAPLEDRLADMRGALELSRQRGDYTGEAHMRAQLTSVYAEHRDYERAYEQGIRAVVIYHATDHAHMSRQLDLVLIQCAYLMGDRDEFTRRLLDFQPELASGDLQHTLERPEVLRLINRISGVDTLARRAELDAAHTSPWWRACEAFMATRWRDPDSLHHEEAIALGTAMRQHEFGLEERLLMRMIWTHLDAETRRLIIESHTPDIPTIYIERDELENLAAVTLTTSAHGMLTRHELARRPVMRMALDALLSRHARTPGDPISAIALAEHVWPEETMTPEALSNRLYNLMAQLKKLGLDELVVSNRDGYWISTTRSIQELGELVCPA